MTAYELASLALEEAAGIRAQVALTQVQIQVIVDLTLGLITLVSGYLVVAYLVGASLSFTQVSILNFLYLLLAFFLVAQGGGAQSAGTFQYSELLDLDPDRGRPIFWTAEANIFATVLWGLIIAASLWFMRTVRHPKTE